MTLEDFVTGYAEKLGMTKVDARSAINLFATMIQSVDSGDGVNIPGFGKFKKSTRAARSGRNPKTGEAISIPEKVLVTFKASK